VLKNRPIVEERINALTHLLPCIIAFSYTFNAPIARVPFFLFSACTFFFSFLYHSTNDDLLLKAARQQLDITSIFWLIPATLLEHLPLIPGGMFFLTAIIFSVPTIFFYMPERFTDVMLVTLSILGVALAFVFFDGANVSFFVGLVIYAMGLPFYFLGERPWMHMVWHVFVCGGWAVHAWG
jgi:predicted membrane channel-forming protein YqfA (hemolysin III family)